MIRSECIRNASVTPRNTEYTKYDPPGAQVSDDALAQKYLLYTPPARLKLRYRELDDENTTTYGRISSKPQHTPPKNSKNGRTETVRPPPPWLYLAITWPKIIPQKMLSNRNTRHERARHQATRRGVARRIYHSMASLLHC